jgi:cell division septation protein DedD
MFKVQTEADALVRRLQAAGYVATASSQGDVYRVFVGGYFDWKTADRLATTLRKAGFEAVLMP